MLGIGPIGVDSIGVPTPTKQDISALARLLKSDPQKEAAYYEQLGRFIASYSSAEAQIHALARFYSRTDDTRARLIFGGFRLTDTIDRLRALLRVPDRPGVGILGSMLTVEQVKQSEIVESCLKQFQIIGHQRDKLVHRTIIYYEETGFTVSNGQTAKSIANAELSLVITLQDLKDMIIDCDMAFLALRNIANPEKPPWGFAGTPTWRYKPPPPSPQKSERPAGRRERKRQRRASQRSPAPG